MRRCGVWASLSRLHAGHQRTGRVFAEPDGSDGVVGLLVADLGTNRPSDCEVSLDARMVVEPMPEKKHEMLSRFLNNFKGPVDWGVYRVKIKAVEGDCRGSRCPVVRHAAVQPAQVRPPPQTPPPQPQQPPPEEPGEYQGVSTVACPLLLCTAST